MTRRTGVEESRTGRTVRRPVREIRRKPVETVRSQTDQQENAVLKTRTSLSFRLLFRLSPERSTRGQPPPFPIYSYISRQYVTVTHLSQPFASHTLSIVFQFFSSVLFRSLRRSSTALTANGFPSPRHTPKPSQPVPPHLVQHPRHYLVAAPRSPCSPVRTHHASPFPPHSVPFVALRDHFRT